MQEELKTNVGALNGEADRIPLTVDDLNKKETDLTAELESALVSADAESIFSIREQLSRIPLMRTAAEIEATRRRLQEVEVEIERNTENISLINAVRRQKNAEYAQKVKELEPYQQAVSEWDSKLSLAKNEGVLRQMELREKKAKLFSLSDEIRK